MPFALVIGDPAQLPLWQLQLDQGEGRIGPGAGFEQPFEAKRFFALSERGKASACCADDVGHDVGGNGIGVTKTLAEFGIPGVRVEGRSGVWLVDESRPTGDKIAAIGIRVAEGVTMHGFALNCDNSPSAYDAIVACGIRNATVTTLSAELGRQVAVNDVLPLLEQHLPALSATVRSG
mgnify:CR=1 FL=1